MKEQLEKTEDGSWRVRVGTPLEKFITEMLHTAWGSSMGDYFPGPQPISIERKHFGLFKKKAYVICEKSDGVRHVFMAFTYGETRMCVLVNRAFEITLAPLSLPKVAYQGTLLDGELVTTNFVNQTYLVYDSVVVNGKSTASLNLFDRLRQGETVVSGIRKMATDPIVLRMKTFFNPRDLDEFQNSYVPSLDYKTDGIVFTPVDDPIRIGTHETLFKWKHRDQNTIDFKAKMTGTKWSLYVQEKGTLMFESELSLAQAPEWITENCIVECQYMVDEEPRWWKPLNIRRDKVHPNNRRTFYNTLKNIKENIQLNEFGKVF
jgi:hypothetical protein